MSVEQATLQSKESKKVLIKQNPNDTVEMIQKSKLELSKREKHNYRNDDRKGGNVRNAYKSKASDKRLYRSPLKSQRASSKNIKSTPSLKQSSSKKNCSACKIKQSSSSKAIVQQQNSGIKVKKLIINKDFDELIQMKLGDLKQTLKSRRILLDNGQTQKSISIRSLDKTIVTILHQIREQFEEPRQTTRSNLKNSNSKRQSPQKASPVVKNSLKIS